MSNIAIITARGGSKRIPRKNIKFFSGKPIIAYSIEAALKANLFDDVIVSTDDQEIADISRSFGANVPFFRSSKASDDFATTQDVLEEVVNDLSLLGLSYDFTTCIYPTAPFLTPDILVKAFHCLIDTGADMIQPVVRYDFPPQRAFVENDGYLDYWFPEYANSRSQDLSPIFHDAGQFYMYKTDEISNDQRVRTFILQDPMLVQDIDTLSDWTLAELKFKLIKEMQRDTAGFNQFQ